MPPPLASLVAGMSASVRSQAPSHQDQHTLPPRRRTDRGQTTIEFIGGLLVICAILGALYALVPDVRHQIDQLVDRALTQMRDGPG